MRIDGRNARLDEDLATQIQDLMFVFENLVEVDDQGIQNCCVMFRKMSCKSPQRGRRYAAREDLHEHVETCC